MSLCDPHADQVAEQGVDIFPERLARPERSYIVGENGLHQGAKTASKALINPEIPVVRVRGQPTLPGRHNKRQLLCAGRGFKRTKQGDNRQQELADTPRYQLSAVPARCRRGRA